MDVKECDYCDKLAVLEVNEETDPGAHSGHYGAYCQDHVESHKRDYRDFKEVVGRRLYPCAGVQGCPCAPSETVPLASRALSPVEQGLHLIITDLERVLDEVRRSENGLADVGPQLYGYARGIVTALRAALKAGEPMVIHYPETQVSSSGGREFTRH